MIYWKLIQCFSSYTMQQLCPRTRNILFQRMKDLHMRQLCYKTGISMDDNNIKDSNDWVKPSGFDTGIKVYNTLTKRKDPFILPNGSIATW